MVAHARFELVHILVMPWANIIAIPYCAAGARPSVLSIQGAPLRLRAGGPSGVMPFGHIMSLSRDVCSRVCPAALRTGHGLLSLRLLSARLFCCVIKPKNDLVLAHYSTGVFRFMTAGRGAWREKAEEGASSCFRGEEVAWKRSGLGFTASPGIKSRI